MKKDKISNESKTELQNFSKGYITFPFDESSFKSFIVGLLGKPQTISKSITGQFEIYLKDIQNFHDLISQRIEQQNNGRLIQFRTNIYFSDQSNVELNSYDELITYNQIKPVISTSVKLSWSYLIQFSDKRAPEKQEIEIYIISTAERSPIIGKELAFLIFGGEFRIIIQHTARTWGDDIESLLTNQINSLVTNDSKIRRYIREKSSIISLIIASLFVLCSMIATLIISDTFYKTETKKINTYIQSNTALSDKIDFLLRYYASGILSTHGLKIISYIIVSVIIAIFLATWVENLADTRSQSYIILTRESVKFTAKSKARIRKRWYLFLFSIVLSIVINIISSIIFKILSN